MMAREGFKHMVKCRCVLPQLRNRPDPPNHQFQVFSVVETDGAVRPKIVRCSGCGILHRVKELCTSTIMERDEGAGIMSIDDLRDGFDPKLAALLDREGADLATWEAVSFIIEEGRWGDTVVLSSERVEGSRQGKYLRVFGPGLFKVEPFVRDDVASREGR